MMPRCAEVVEDRPAEAGDQLPGDPCCATCGCSLRGATHSSGRCPECGFPYDVSSLLQRAAAPRGFGLALALYAVIPIWLLLAIIPYYVNGRAWYNWAVAGTPPAGSVEQVDDPGNTRPFN